MTALGTTQPKNGLIRRALDFESTYDLRRLAVSSKPIMLTAMLCASSCPSLVSALAALALVCAPARADEPGSAPSPSDREAMVQAYGEFNADCLEWTDSCTICRRVEGAEAACSTPGVACQPGDIVCRVKREGGASSPQAK
jgi:hypothetical protein